MKIDPEILIMEDERGDGGHDGSGGAPPEPPLSGKLAGESVVENTGSDNRAEEVFEEGDGEEIMVEVVGSDVYVDGVSGNGEGDCEMGEAEDLEGRVVEKNEESTDVSREGDDNKMAEGCLGLLESRDDKDGVTEKVDIDLSKSVGDEGEKVAALPLGGSGGVVDEAQNPGIKATDESSSEASVPPTKVVGESAMDISEEEKTKDEAVDKDISDLVTPESSNHPVETVSDEKSNLADKREVLPSSNNSTSHDHAAVDSVKSHGATEETHDDIDGAAGQVHSVNVSGGGELLDSGTQKDGSFRGKVECPSTDGDIGIQDNYASEKDVLAAESKDSIPKPDALISDVVDESQSCLDELHGAKIEPDDQTDGASHTAGPESIHENSCDSRRGETGGEKFDNVLGIKDVASNTNLQDLCSVGNDECSKTEGELETHKAQNDVISSTPIQLADGGDTAEVKDDAEENVQNNTSLSCPKESVQSDSDQPVIASTVEAETAPTVGAETSDQNAVISQVKFVDEAESCVKGEDINSEILGKSLAGHEKAEIPALDDSAENMHLPEDGGRSKVETADAMVTEDHVPCHDLTSEAPIIVVGVCGSPHSTKQVVALQITETSDHEADKLEHTNMVPNEVTSVAADSDTVHVSIIPEGTSNTESHVSSTDISLLDGDGIQENCDEVYKSKEADEIPRESNGFYVVETLEGNTSEAKPMDVEEERESDRTYHGGQEVDAELATEEPFESDQLKMSNEEPVNYAGFLRMKQSGYLTSPENEGCFTPSDLVWGKVRSHPWWPGQIFDPEDASEKAVKYYKKDSFLVAYFGDQTFAWNDSSALKPFRSYFSQIEKQSNSESFHNAVNCALEEVERRVHLGLSCSCIPKDDYAKIETQVMENTGIREESSRRYGVDQSSCASRFEPNELIEFLRAVAPRASSGADQLDLVIARAQLSAFCSFKGYRSPTEFPLAEDLLEIDGDTEQVSDEAVASHKHRHIPKEGAQSRKERSLMELMGDGEYSPDAEDDSVAGDLGKSVPLSSGKKRKALDPLAEGSDKRVSFSAAKVPTPTSQAPKPSFKIGECIRRVASQLTGSTSLVKGSNDEMAVDGSPSIYEPSEKQSTVVSSESLSVSDLLSQLELAAQDPKKRHIVQNDIRSFFMGFRSSIALSRRGRKKRSEQAVGGSGEEFEFDDVNDSYWTDRIVQNYSAEQLLHERMNGTGNLQLVPFNVEKSVKVGRKSHSRKRLSSGNSPTSAPEFDENAKRIKQESSPAELILNFAERNCVPSEINLNKMFRRFGPLMESETEVDHESGSAKVIFKRGSDAEVARNSAEKFSIFGPVLVNYQIGYSPVISVKILPVTITQIQEEATMML
ncbi:hypothetical protein C2S51_017287 [Perilla frutescens var. frutescens]|nr:hypothetical protein C2S51_017287 [Perilla frutescens var. frutescens]